jgi:Tol biopolymer transport system component
MKPQTATARSSWLVALALVVLQGPPITRIEAQASNNAAASSAPMYHYPRWSPDGARIVAVAMSGRGSEIVIIPARGGKPAVVPTGGIAPRTADWTSAGEITFVSDSGKWFIVDTNGRALRPGRPDSIVTATRDSGVLLFERSPDFGAIYATDRRRSVARQLTHGFWAEQPSISPDDRQVVFEKRIDPNDMAGSEVVLMNLDGTRQRTLTRGTDPSWSKDGKSILHKAMDTDGALWISIVDVATGTVRRLTPGVHPQWSPSGDRIVYMLDRPDGSTQIRLMTAAGADDVCLTCR